MDEALLLSELSRFGLSADKAALRRFALYADMLTDWNSRVNLTAITSPQGIVYRHFADSAAVFSACKIPEGASLVDVGTGAGFPAVVLKILQPDIKITLLDAQRKRTEFLRALLDALELQGKIICSRAEEAARLAALRESFDIVTARAVADLRILSELCLPFVKPGGYFLALKGPNIEKELEGAKNAIKILGAKLYAVKPAVLGDSSGRSIIITKKISQISSKYPRIYGKITKSPL